MVLDSYLSKTFGISLVNWSLFQTEAQRKLLFLLTIIHKKNSPFSLSKMANGSKPAPTTLALQPHNQAKSKILNLSE